jgi:hypothetical protein
MTAGSPVPATHAPARCTPRSPVILASSATSARCSGVCGASAPACENGT